MRAAATLRLAQTLEAQARLQPHPSQRSDLSLDVARALDALPEAQAELVRLVHWDGFTIDEAGRIMGVGDSTARGRYASARAILRAQLGAGRSSSSSAKQKAEFAR